MQRNAQEVSKTTSLNMNEDIQNRNVFTNL